MPWQKKKTEYEVLGYLGKGGFGHISKIRRLSDGKILAMKKIDLSKQNAASLRRLDDEIRLHCSLDHDFIVRVDSFEDDKETNCRLIFMELCEGGDLDKYIAKRRETNDYIPEDDIWKLFAQIVDALNYCHQPSERDNDEFPLPILHRDLKPENIFLTKDHSEVRVGDFGFARELDDGEDAYSDVGTPGFMCPEILNKQGYNEAADLFSLGAILYEMCTLQWLIDWDRPTSITRDQYLAQVDTTIPSHYSKELAILIRLLLEFDDTVRPGTKAMMKMSTVKLARARHTMAVQSASHKVSLSYWQKAAAKAESTVKGLQEKVRALETQSAQSVGDNKHRSAALDARERVLNQRERQLHVELEQQTATQKSVHAQEQQLIRDRVAMNHGHSIRRKHLDARERNLVLREHLLSEKCDSPMQETSAESSRIVSSLVVQEVVANTSAQTLSVGRTCAVTSPLNVSTSVKGQVPAHPTLRRVARRTNLRVDVLPVTKVESSPMSDSTSNVIASNPRRKLRSDGDLHAIVLAPNAKSDIPIPSSRIPVRKIANILDQRKPVALENKANHGEKQSQGLQAIAAPPKSLHVCRTSPYQLRSVTAKALQGANLRCL